MPVINALWKVAPTPVRLSISSLINERMLHDMILTDVTLISEDWLVIGSEIRTDHGKRPDVLAIAPDGSLIVIELKRAKTPREITAQVIEYASWIENLDSQEIASIYRGYSKGGDLSFAFKERFGIELADVDLNQTHQMIIVASHIDIHTERILIYLNNRGVSINAIQFQVFTDGVSQFISRSWLVDPALTQFAPSITRTSDATWNGEYYVSFGEGDTRSWEDAQNFGFISAGGGAWYSRTLTMLKEGDRIWVRIPKVGFVGVGKVIGPAVPFQDFTVDKDGISMPFEQVSPIAAYHHDPANPEAGEWFVPIEWIRTVPVVQAVDELGFFGNQNSVCRPQAQKWVHTISRLKTLFDISD